MNKNPSGLWRIVIFIILAVGVIIFAVSGYLSPLLRSAIDPFVSVQSWISQRYMTIYEFVTVPRDVASLRQQVNLLENENSRLQTEIIQLQQQLSEASVLYALLDFARARPENEYIASAVIGRDPSPFLHYIIIDHGSDDGILYGMPVVTQQGLVGRVEAVTSGAARVQLITDPGSAVNVHIQQSQTEGLLNGSITGETNIEMIPQDVQLQLGSLVLTSGLGGNYPNDILVGQLVSLRKRENDLFQSASVQLNVDFARLRAVLVITNFKPVNIQPLIPAVSQ